MFSLAQAHSALGDDGIGDPTLAKLLERSVAGFVAEVSALAKRA
jgi:hypothetical protein